MDDTTEASEKTTEEAAEETAEATPSEQESSETQESSEVKSDPSLFRPYTYKRPEDHQSCLAEHLEILRDALKMTELQKLAALEQTIHSSYYLSWIQTSNSIFHTMARLRARLKESRESDN